MLLVFPPPLLLRMPSLELRPQYYNSTSWWLEFSSLTVLFTSYSSKCPRAAAPGPPPPPQAAPAGTAESTPGPKFVIQALWPCCSTGNIHQFVRAIRVLWVGEGRERRGGSGTWPSSTETLNCPSGELSPAGICQEEGHVDFVNA
jgi:hypothetical protein